MKAKKRKGRVRQTRTDWQKTFDPHPGMLQPFSWSDRLPEVLHISMALIDHDYQTVKTDFYRIADLINEKKKLSRKFHFNLSHTVRLIKQDPTILAEIFNSSFKASFEQILSFYNKILEINLDYEIKRNIKLLFLGYKHILDGRADTSILSKYIMVQYEQSGRQDAFNLFNWNTKEEILEPMNVSSVMSLFPPSIGLSENLDLEFCQNIWMYNYSISPLMPKPDDSNEEEKHFNEMNVEELSDEFKELYSQFKKLNLLAVYPKLIAEINMGFIARICNLSLEAVDFVKVHKGEVAELVFRTILETFIVGTWLLKKQDAKLHQRFREFSTGRQRFFGEQIAEKAPNEEMKNEAEKMIDDTIKEAGVRHFEVATERGDIFELNISQMATEVWGEDNHYYFLYKRSSEVVHGHWRVISKYHLAKSYNPMHNGLYWYNDNPNRFAGLVPAFTCLGLAVEFLITILKDIESEQTKELTDKITDLKERIWKQWMVYYNTYILPIKTEEAQ